MKKTIRLSTFLSKRSSSSITHPEEASSYASESLTTGSTYSSKHTEEVTLMQLREFCRLFHIRISEVQIYRYACCYDFDYDRARKAIEQSYDSPYLHLRMTSNGSLVDQFLKRVIFPLPRTRSLQKSQVIYIHAERYSAENNDLFMDSLYYLLNDMSRTKKDCRNGVCIIVNMKNYYNDMENNMDTTILLEAAKATIMESNNSKLLLVPTRITSILFLDAPKVFVTSLYGKFLKPILSTLNLQKKVHFIKSTEHNGLGDFLMDGYKDCLPEELGGWKHSLEIAEDYVDQKIYEEKSS